MRYPPSFYSALRSPRIGLNARFIDRMESELTQNSEAPRGKVGCHVHHRYGQLANSLSPPHEADDRSAARHLRSLLESFWTGNTVSMMEGRALPLCFFEKSPMGEFSCKLILMLLAFFQEV
jgi:hypothetical protein